MKVNALRDREELLVTKLCIDAMLSYLAANWARADGGIAYTSAIRLEVNLLAPVDVILY